MCLCSSRVYQMRIYILCLCKGFEGCKIIYDERFLRLNNPENDIKRLVPLLQLMGVLDSSDFVIHRHG